MKELNLKNNKLKMKLFFDGELNIVDDKNGMLFEFVNDEFFINGFLQPIKKNVSFDEVIDDQIKILKSVDFSTSKVDFLKKELGNLEDTKVTDFKKIVTKFKNSGILMISKDDKKQLQFHTETEKGMIILGLIDLKEKLTFKSQKTIEAIENIINSINSIEI